MKILQLLIEIYRLVEIIDTRSGGTSIAYYKIPLLIY